MLIPHKTCYQSLLATGVLLPQATVTHLSLSLPVTVMLEAWLHWQVGNFKPGLPVTRSLLLITRRAQINLNKAFQDDPRLL